jgi:hypothetical protein
MHTSHPFAHRTNANGTIDSICKTCFATVGIREDPDDPNLLKKLEHSHVCDEWHLEVITVVLNKAISRRNVGSSPHARRA